MAPVKTKKQWNSQTITWWRGHDETTEEEKEESDDDKQVSDDDEDEESQNTVGQTQCVSLESQQTISTEVDEVEETCKLSLTSSPYAAPITFFMQKKN